MLDGRKSCLRYSVAALAAGLGSASMLASPAYAVDLTSSVINANMDQAYASFNATTNPKSLLSQGRDTFVKNGNFVASDGWRLWAGGNDGGSQMRLWNPSTTNRWGNAGNEFYDTSWGGNDASGNADGHVLMVHTMNWDYRPSSSITASTDLATVWHDPYNNRVWDVPNGNNTYTGSPYPANTYKWRQDDGGNPTVNGGTNYSGQGTPATGWFDTASRNFEAAAQMTSAIFDPTAKYKLSVKVGRLHADGLNSGAVVTPGTDGAYGTGDDGSATSTRFLNDAPARWGGYTVDLMAGGVTDASTSSGTYFGGWVYGTTADPNAADYIKTLATDNNSLAILADSWGHSIVTYTPSTSVDVSALVGKKLVIRLSALETPGAHEYTNSVAFDDVQLIKIIAGDANEDDLVNSDDYFLVDQAYARGAVNPGWAGGDFDGNGLVDASDYFLLDLAFMTAPLPASSPTAVPEPSAILPLVLAGMLGLKRRS